MLFKDVLMRTRGALSLYKVYGDSTLLVPNGISLNGVNALLAISRQSLIKKGLSILSFVHISLCLPHDELTYKLSDDLFLMNVHTEHQKKLIPPLERRSIKSAASN